MIASSRLGVVDRIDHCLRVYLLSDCPLLKDRSGVACFSMIDGSFLSALWVDLGASSPSIQLSITFFKKFEDRFTNLSQLRVTAECMLQRSFLTFGFNIFIDLYELYF